MRWSFALIVLLPGVLSAYACNDAHQPGQGPSILQHQPDVPSIGDRKYRDRDPFAASGGASSGTGGSHSQGGNGEGGQGGAGLGGQGGEAPW